jgi:hypothetical protein
MKGSVIWLSLHSKVQTDIKGKQHAWKLWTQLLVGTKKCRKNLRVSHDTTLLSIYLSIYLSVYLSMMIFFKIGVSFLFSWSWQNYSLSLLWLFINDGLKLLLLFNIITIAGHAWAVLSSQTFQHRPESGSDHHTGSMLAIFRQFFLLEFPIMDPMDFNRWNSSLSFLYGSIKTIWCVGGHGPAIAQ